jgi:hypothetical protein
VRKKPLAAAAAFAALTVASVALTLGGTANAGPSKAESVHAAKCSTFGAKARESVKIRKTAKNHGTPVGLFPKGAKGCFNSSGDGQKNGDCGKGSNSVWSHVSYKGNKGYVPSRCISILK